MNKKVWIGAVVMVVVVAVALLIMQSDSPSSKSLSLGATFPLTGEVASAGQRIRNGIELAVSELNKGREGPKVAVTFEDDQNKPALAVGNVKKLIDMDHVIAVLGSAASGCTRAMMPVAIQRKTVVLSPISSSVSLSTEGGGFFFRVAPADDAQAKVAASWIIKQRKGSVAIVFVNNDWGRSLAESVRDLLARENVEVVAFEGIAESQRDLRTVIEVVRQSGASLLYSPTYPVDGGLLVRQVREMGVSLELVGGDNWGSPEFQTTAGSAVDGCYVIKAIDPSGENYSRFKAAFEKRFGKTPDNFATWSYDATKVLVEAIDSTGGKGGADLALALRKVNIEGASGKIAFDEHGDVKYPRFGVFRYSGEKLVPQKETE